MTDAIYTATSGAIAYQMRLDILANNLANANTVGFKEDRTVFTANLPEYFSLPEEISDNPNTQNPYPTNVHVSLEHTVTDFSEGEMKHTGNALDMAISGNGFFCINTPDGIQYTKKGNFTLNQEGALVTHDGFEVQGEGGQIIISGEHIMVDEKGNISVDGNPAGRIKIVGFSDTAKLEKVGSNAFKPADSDTTEETSEEAKVTQGFVELSNVDTLRVMTEMIEVLRGYEAYQKIIQSMDRVESDAINEVGNVT